MNININEEKINPSVTTQEDDSSGITSPEQEIRAEKIMKLSDRMLEKISRALDEVDVCVTKDKRRIKEVEYDEELKKPVKETYTETEDIRFEKSNVDTSSLKQLVSTLKDLRDIQLGIQARYDDGDDEERGVIVISEILNMEEKNESHMDTPKKAGNLSGSSRI